MTTFIQLSRTAAAWTLLLIASQAFGQSADLVVQDTTVSSAAIFTASHSVTAGPAFVVAAGGEATFVTGGSVFLRNGFAVAGGGAFNAVNDPALLGVRPQSGLPRGYTLRQNYPNPFNPSTNISFSIREKSYVSLVVFNLLGQPVATLVDGEFPAGEHEVRFTLNGLASGIYVYRMTAKGFTASRTMLLLK